MSIGDARLSMVRGFGGDDGKRGKVESSRSAGLEVKAGRGSGVVQNSPEAEK